MAAIVPPCTATAASTDQIAALRGRVATLRGRASVVIHRRCEESNTRVKFAPHQATTTCTELIIECSNIGRDVDDGAQRLGELLRLIHVAITECHPAILNEAVLGSRCPLTACDFCDASTRVGVIRLFGAAPSESRVFRKALFTWAPETASEEFCQLYGLLRRSANATSPSNTVSGRPKKPRPLRFVVGLSIQGWWRNEFTGEEHLDDAKRFIDAAKAGCDIGELEGIHIYHTGIIGETSELEPILRTYVSSGLPISLGEPRGRGLWRRIKDDWSWLVGNGSTVTQCYSTGRLVGLTLDKVNGPTHEEWDGLCRMLQTPSVRQHLRILTLNTGIPSKCGLFDQDAPKQFARAIFDPSFPLHLNYLALSRSFENSVLAAMVEGRDEVLQGHPCVVTFGHVIIDSSNISDVGFNDVIRLVGATVKRLELIGESRSISPKVLRRILTECRQLEHLSARLSNEDWELHLNSGQIVAPLQELVVDAGVTSAHHFNQNHARRSPVPTSMLTSLLRLVGSNLRSLNIRLPTTATADKHVVQALVKHCPRLQSLGLSNIGEEFLSSLVIAMEAPPRPWRVRSLQLPLHCVSPTSPLTKALLDSHSRTYNNLTGLSLCITTVEFADRELIQQSLQSLGDLLHQNSTLVNIRIQDTAFHYAGPDKQSLIRWILKSDKRLTDAMARPSKTLQLAFLSSLRRLSVAGNGIPVEVVEQIWEYQHRQRPRRITMNATYHYWQ